MPERLYDLSVKSDLSDLFLANPPLMCVAAKEGGVKYFYHPDRGLVDVEKDFQECRKKFASANCDQQEIIPPEFLIRCMESKGYLSISDRSEVLSLNKGIIGLSC